jgi:hypothetical protein
MRKIKLCSDLRWALFICLAMATVVISPSLSNAETTGNRPVVAVVSMSVNDYSKMLTSASGADAAMLINDNMNKMLKTTEEELAKYWDVKSASSFIGDPAYIKLSIGKVRQGLFSPEAGKNQMPNFTDERSEVIKAVLKADTAKALCETLKVDYLAVIYSEWAVATGKFVPTNKALAKNCMAMYNKEGKQIFFSRKDYNGEKVLGAVGNIALNEETISEWVNAYNKGIEFILNSENKKVE